MIPYPGMFYWRNKTRSIPLFILVSLSVAVVGVVATLTGSILGSIYNVDVQPFKHFTLLVSKEMTINDSLLQSLQTDRSIEFLVPFLDSSIRTTGLFGSERRRVYALDQHYTPLVLEKLGLHLETGALPSPGSAEIVLHESIMKSRNLRIGDLVGQEVDKNDYLWGTFQISGVLSGPLPFGIASLEFFKQQWMFDLGDNVYAVMAFPTNDLATMNKALQETSAGRLIIRDFDLVFEAYRDESREMDLLLWILNAAIIIIISLSMGMLNTIHFLGRMREYGILFLIGLDLRALIRRTLVEVCILSLVGFTGGTALAWVLTWIIRTRIFAPRGIPVQIYSLRYLSFTLPILVALALFSFLTISWQIRKLDVIAIIEGRD